MRGLITYNEGFFSVFTKIFSENTSPAMKTCFNFFFWSSPISSGKNGNSLGQGWATPGTRAELGTRALFSGTRAIWPFNFLGDESWILADVMTLFFFFCSLPDFGTKIGHQRT